MAEKKSVIVDYTQGNLFRQLMVFALPFILSALLQNLYSLVDTMVVGQVVGSGGLSGVSTSGQITGLMTNMVMGFSTAGQVMISQYVGAKKPENLRRTVGTAFTITTLFALVLMVVCIGFSNTILRWMNTPAEAFRQARQYLIICSFGFVFVCGYNTACAILRGSGDSKRPFAIIAATSIANLVLDLVFVVGFKMESAGAALATVISQAISMALSMRIFYRHREDFGFTFRLSSFRMDPHELKLLVRQGVPLALKSGSISLSGLFINSFINSYGVTASAAMAVGQKLQHLPNIVTSGFSSAGMAMIGQNVGAGNYDRVKRIVYINLTICLVLFGVVSVVFLAFPYGFFRLFTSDEAVLAYAPAFMKVMVVMFVACAFMSPYYAVINGVGNADFNLIISVLDGIVLRIGLGLLFGLVFRMGAVGFFLGSALAAFGTTIPAMIYFYSGRWKTFRLDKSKKA